MNDEECRELLHDANKCLPDMLQCNFDTPHNNLPSRELDMTDMYGKVNTQTSQTSTLS